MLRDVFHLFFPRVCSACRGALEQNSQLICARCAVKLPRTGYHLDPENPIAQRFFGLLPVSHALAYLHFSKGGMVQELLHQLKYKGQFGVGELLGRWYGRELREVGLAEEWDVIIPIPLHPRKQKRRGYNQSDAIAFGLASTLKIPAITDAVVRQQSTDTQTRKNRSERYKNMSGVFAVRQAEAIAGKRILLVDDVMTTGATLIACGEVLMKSGARTLSVATLASAQ